MPESVYHQNVGGRTDSGQRSNDLTALQKRKRATGMLLPDCLFSSLYPSGVVSF